MMEKSFPFLLCLLLRLRNEDVEQQTRKIGDGFKGVDRVQRRSPEVWDRHVFSGSLLQGRLGYSLCAPTQYNVTNLLFRQYYY